MLKSLLFFFVLSLVACASTNYQFNDETGGVAPTVEYGDLKLTKMVPPNYPREVQDAGITGVVKIRFVVLETGATSDLSVSQPTNSVLDQFALDAVSKWKFEPYSAVDGRLVTLQVPVTFSLD